MFFRYYRESEYNQNIIYTLRATVHSRTSEIIGVCDNIETGLQSEFGWNKVCITPILN
jgi:hypothetical protein